MTRYLADIASYQGSLQPAAVKAAGFTAVNLKISHGLGMKSVHPHVASWISAAGSLGLTVTTFHWLTAVDDGAAQARYAWSRMQALGLTAVGHIVDIEEPSITWATIEAYVTTMRSLGGDVKVIYSADWRWEKKWAGSTLTPYLWAAPNDGYLPAYPGDDSAHWRAGYGGWSELAVMQYAVNPIAGIKVSMSAIRSESVWTALTTRVAPATGEDAAVSSWILVPSLVSLRTEFNRLSPSRDKASDGSIGDSSHSSVSDHTPDEDSDYLRDHDADRKNEVHALDIDSTGPWPRSFDSIVKGIIARERTRWLDPNDRCRLKYVIWNRKIYSQDSDFLARDHTGPDPHTNHVHFSGRYETGCENDTSPWGVAPEAQTPTAPNVPAKPVEEDLVTSQAQFNELMDTYIAGAGRDLWARRLNSYDPGYGSDGRSTPNGAVRNLTTDDPANPTVGPATALERAQVAAVLAYQIRDAIGLVLDATQAILKNVVKDDGDLAEIKAAIESARADILAEIVDPGNPATR